MHTTKWKKGCLSLLVLLGVLAAQYPVLAEEMAGFVTVTTVKRAIAGQNIQQVRQGAVSDALADSIKNAVIRLVTTRTLSSNLDFLYHQILPRSIDYIITYRVLGEVQSKGELLLALESRVNLGLLEKALTDARILEAGKDKPALLFFISEKKPSDDQSRIWWGGSAPSYHSAAEESLLARMIQDRFPVTGTGQDRPNPSFYGISFQSADDISAALDLGRALKADMIVFGSAAVLGAANRMGGEKTFTAEIRVDAYDVQTREKAVTSATQATAKSEIDAEGHMRALTRAGEVSASDLGEKINAYWSRNLRKEQTFLLKLSGENFLPRFLALKQRLREIPEIVSLLQKEAASKSALMEIHYKGKPSQFANAVMLKTFDSFGLEIGEVSEGQVSILFIEKERGPSQNAAQPGGPLPESKKGRTE